MPCAALTFTGDPFLSPPEECCVYRHDALIVIEDGRIASIADAASMRLPSDIAVTHFEMH